MNKKDQILQRTRNWHSYHVHGGAAYKTVKKNVIFPWSSKDDTEVHDKHEHCKLAICLQLKRMGCEYITEAVENKTKLRRDIVCLDSGNIYEVETTKKRAARPELKGTIVCCVEGMTLVEAIIYCAEQAEKNG
jgi:hypothetical protein